MFFLTLLPTGYSELVNLNMVVFRFKNKDKDKGTTNWNWAGQKNFSLKIDKVIQNKSLKFYKDNIFKFQTWIFEIELRLHTPQHFSTSLYKIKVLFSLSLKLNPKITLDHH